MEMMVILTAVAFIWGVAVITPGPNFFITIQVSASKSRYAAFYVVAGIATGTLIWGICGFLGVNMLFTAAPWLYALLKLAGATYLLYLGLRLILRQQGNKHKDDSAAQIVMDRRRFFRLGLITNLSNPKTAAFVASLFAATLPPVPSLAIGVLSIGLMMLISILWYTLVACAFSLSSVSSRYRLLRSSIEKIAGLIFIGFGIHLITSE